MLNSGGKPCHENLLKLYKCYHILKGLDLCEQICHEVHLTLDKCYHILKGSDLCELSSGIIMWTSVVTF